MASSTRATRSFTGSSLLLSAMLMVSGLVAGCASNFVTVASEPPEKYEVLGSARGTASGSLGILATAYYGIPMGLNSRVQRAYDDAVQSVPGATGLIDVTYQESWYWWWIGTARSVTVSGTAIKGAKQ